MTVRSCSTCQWAELVILDADDGTIGHNCHRWPPQLIDTDGVAAVAQLWPQMDGTDWCAEHTPTEDTDHE